VLRYGTIRQKSLIGLESLYSIQVYLAHMAREVEGALPDYFYIVLDSS